MTQKKENNKKKRYDNTLFKSGFPKPVEVQDTEPHRYLRIGGRPILFLHLFLHQQCHPEQREGSVNINVNAFRFFGQSPQQLVFTTFRMTRK